MIPSLLYDLKSRVFLLIKFKLLPVKDFPLKDHDIHVACLTDGFIRTAVNDQDIGQLSGRQLSIFSLQLWLS